ncbi:MAG: hypothetical protein E7318_11320 [Clostridiales bacterium]|nr:hypothetical protein [Clostridiales bacterium]
MGTTLRRCRWMANARNDHDHCAFCWDKFAEYNGCLQEGYCTEAGNNWICEACFNDFRERFGWRVKSCSSAP